METYTLPREAFDILQESLGGKQKAEVLARTFESVISSIQQRAKEEILEQRQLLKVAIKDELKQELVTREIFEERSNVIEERFNVIEECFKSLENTMAEKFKVVDEKFASLHFKMNIFIAIALIALTFANPTFVQLLQKLF
jgi:hypothetical protein